MPSNPHFLIVGGGVAGLTLAASLNKRCAAGGCVTLLEASERVGGWLQTESIDGFSLERGARTMRPSFETEGAQAFLAERGIPIEEASPASKKRALYWKGALHSIPTHPLDWLRSPLLRGCRLRLLKDLFLPSSKEEMSVGSFFRRRLGKRFTERLIEPFILGVYGGGLEELSIQSAFPSLWEMEQKRGSLLRGALRMPRRKQPPLFRPAGGMGKLIERLHAELGEAILTHQKVEAILPHQGGWIAKSSTGKQIRADQLILALPPHQAAPLLLPIDPEGGHFFASLPVNSLQVVHLGWKEAPQSLEGFGYLIPTSEGEDLLGILFDSSIYPSSAPKGGLLLTAMAHPHIHNPIEAALEGVKKQLSLQETPDLCRTHFCEKALFLPTVGFASSLSRLHKRLADRAPSLHLHGGSVGTRGVAQHIAQAESAAARIYRIPISSRSDDGSAPSST